MKPRTSTIIKTLRDAAFMLREGVAAMADPKHPQSRKHDQMADRCEALANRLVGTEGDT